MSRPTMRSIGSTRTDKPIRVRRSSQSSASCRRAVSVSNQRASLPGGPRCERCPRQCTYPRTAWMRVLMTARVESRFSSATSSPVKACPNPIAKITSRTQKTADSCSHRGRQSPLVNATRVVRLPLTLSMRQTTICMTPKKRKRSKTVRSLAQTSGAAIESHSVDIDGSMSRT